MELRTLGADDLDELMALDASIWGYRTTPAGSAAMRDLLEWPRTVGAVDAGRLVGSAAAYSLELTVPGGTAVPMAGVTWVGIHPTHRRRGLLRSMMARLVADATTRAEPVAGLFASESAIYRRFGFGPATRIATCEIATTHRDLRVPVRWSGTIEAVRPEERDRVVGEVYDAVCRVRSGMTTRPAAGHRAMHYDAAEEQEGFAPLQVAAHRDADGLVDGYVTYRLREKWDGELPDLTLRVTELLGTPAAEMRLWQHMLGHDLVSRIEAPHRPPSEPITDLLADPRRLRIRSLTDGLHLLPLDIPRLLGSRRYLRDDALTLEVHASDAGAPPVRVRVAGGIDGAECTPTTAEPDLVLDTAALGSLVLGDTPLERLGRAGLVEERTPGALLRGTGMFLWAPAPHATWVF